MSEPRYASKRIVEDGREVWTVYDRKLKKTVSVGTLTDVARALLRLNKRRRKT